jgi:hypothetical protein
MLFYGGINGIRNDFRHRLAAAHDFRAGILNHRNDISAALTL